MAQSTWITLAVLLGGMALAVSARAAHPLETEDTGTQGVGNVELENGLSLVRSAGSMLFTYQPQVSYGLTPSVDLIVQPSWLSARSAGGATDRGSGDTNLDAKWRFFGEAPLSLGVRAGATLATGQRELGNPHGKTTGHALVVATIDVAPFTVHGNVGVTQNPSRDSNGSEQRAWVTRVSCAVMYAASEKLLLTIDGGTGTSSDPARGAWPITMLVGAIYTVLPSVDVDIGYKSSIASSPSAREWLLGLTWRFAP